LRYAYVKAVKFDAALLPQDFEIVDAVSQRQPEA
jgi:hypothetical protein